MKICLFGIAGVSLGKHNVKDPRLDEADRLVEAKKKVYVQVDVADDKEIATADVIAVSPDSRLDAFASSEFSGLTDRNGKPASRQGPAFATTNPGDSTLGDEVGGVVVDPPHYASSTRH